MTENFFKPILPVSDKANNLLKNFLETVVFDEDGENTFFESYVYKETERDCQVVASFISWLPSNCGSCFLRQAYLNHPMSRPENMFILQFAVENKRVSFINNNFTTLEYLLTPIEYHTLHTGLKCIANQFITVHDVEMINYTLSWLGTKEGFNFLARNSLGETDLC